MGQLPCPSCGAGIEILEGARSAICASCESRFAVQVEHGEATLVHQTARLEERPYFAEAHLQRPRELAVGPSRALQDGSAYGLAAFVVATLVGVGIATSPGVEDDLTAEIALAAALCGMLGFLIGYVRGKR